MRQIKLHLEMITTEKYLWAWECGFWGAHRCCFCTTETQRPSGAEYCGIKTVITDCVLILPSTLQRHNVRACTESAPRLWVWYWARRLGVSHLPIYLCCAGQCNIFWRCTNYWFDTNNSKFTAVQITVLIPIKAGWFAVKLSSQTTFANPISREPHTKNARKVFKSIFNMWE